LWEVGMDGVFVFAHSVESAAESVNNRHQVFNHLLIIEKRRLASCETFVEKVGTL
jgi:hypothetical protein